MMSTHIDATEMIEKARSFSETHLMPHATGFDENESLPAEIISGLAEAGILGATFPKEYGGAELDPLHYGMLTEEIGKGCCSTRTLMTVHTSIVGETLLRWGTPDQKNRWLPQMATGNTLGAFALSEPATGSNAKGITTTYKKEGNAYRLNGHKKWISFAGIADVFIVIAADGDTTSAFIVEREFDGVDIIPQKGMLAGRASHIAEIVLKDVKIPPENLLGREGSGFVYIVGTALDHGRFSVAWGGVAVTQACLEAMVSYTRTREQFGEKLYTFQMIQTLIGDAVTRTHAARALCRNAAELRMKKDPAAVMETNIAKYFSSQAAMTSATDAVQVHGANGCTRNYPVERLFREAKILEIIEGTSQIQQSMIARFGLSEYYRNGGSND